MPSARRPQRPASPAPRPRRSSSVIADAAEQYARESCRAQGIPFTVTDAEALDRVSRVLERHRETVESARSRRVTVA